MQKFAFIIHPIDVRRDFARDMPISRYLPIPVLEMIARRRDPWPIARITGVRSPTGAELEGWLIALPLTPRQFLSLPLDFVYDRLAQAGHIAEELGAGILGLGAFTSVVGDGGITLAKRLKIAVTTGNSFTVATAVQGAVDAARLMGIDLTAAHVAVVGATGSIGATSAEILARDCRTLRLVGRSVDRLGALRDRLAPASRAELLVETNVAEGVRQADIVITVSSAAEAIIQPADLKRGAVVCDVARPRDVSAAVVRERDDVLVIEGGLVSVPGEMRCEHIRKGTPFSFGFPPGTAYACMSETMALALDGRYENFTLGKDVSVQQADEIGAICRRNGFRLSGFRSFERAVSPTEIEAIRDRAGRVPLP